MGIAAGLDVTTANMARVYDYWRGGKESFAADRAQALAIEALYPPGNGPRQMTARNRAWQERAASSAVHDGIGQVHRPRLRLRLPVAAARGREVGHAAARVAYVDADPVVISHGRAMREEVPGVTFAHADLGNPGAVMADPDVRPRAWTRNAGG